MLFSVKKPNYRIYLTFAFFLCVVTLGNTAFSSCIALTSIDIPNSVTNIGNWTFSYCTALTSIDIPNSVTSIGNEVFAYCAALTSVTIGNSVTSIGNEVFAYCSALTSVSVGWATPLPIDSYVFYETNLSECTLYVPEGTKALYEVADVWKDFGTITENPNQGFNPADQEQTVVSIKDGYLLINSPVREKINIYSIAGVPLYSTEKSIGAVGFDLSPIQDKALIIKGSSGWTKKTMK